MKSFEWTNPTTINEAVKLLGVSPSTDIDEAPRPLAGGQDLLTTMKDYTSRPARIVNLKGIGGLNSITLNARGLTIGALVTLTLKWVAADRKLYFSYTSAAARFSSGRLVFRPAT